MNYLYTMTKDEAAAAIGVAPKQVERLVAGGKLTQAMLQLGGRGPKRALYDPAEVARIAAARRTEPGAALLAADSGQPSNGNGNGHQAQLAGRGAIAPAPAPTNDLLPMVFAALRAVASQTSQTEALFLTVAEVAAETKLTEACVRRLIRARGIETVRDGNGVHMRRRDLERL